MSTEGQSPKYLTSAPQNCQGHQRTREPETLLQPKRDPITKNNVVSWVPEQKSNRTLKKVLLAKKVYLKMMTMMIGSLIVTNVNKEQN
jgi:hypothetical protein